MLLTFYSGLKVTTAKRLRRADLYDKGDLTLSSSCGRCRMQTCLMTGKHPDGLGILGIPWLSEAQGHQVVTGAEVLVIEVFSPSCRVFRLELGVLS